MWWRKSREIPFLKLFWTTSFGSMINQKREKICGILSTMFKTPQSWNSCSQLKNFNNGWLIIINNYQIQTWRFPWSQIWHEKKGTIGMRSPGFRESYCLEIIFLIPIFSSISETEVKPLKNWTRQIYRSQRSWKFQVPHQD